MSVCRYVGMYLPLLLLLLRSMSMIFSKNDHLLLLFIVDWLKRKIRCPFSFCFNLSFEFRSEQLGSFLVICYVDAEHTGASLWNGQKDLKLFFYLTFHGCIKMTSELKNLIWNGIRNYWHRNRNCTRLRKNVRDEWCICVVHPFVLLQYTVIIYILSGVECFVPYVSHKRWRKHKSKGKKYSSKIQIAQMCNAQSHDFSLTFSRVRGWRLLCKAPNECTQCTLCAWKMCM